jgi:hypothetical protein
MAITEPLSAKKDLHTKSIIYHWICKTSSITHNITEEQYTNINT